VTLTTSPEDTDLVNSALVFAQQVQQANVGVTVNVNQITNDAYNVGFTTWPFTQGYWAAGIIGTGYSSRFIPGSPNNDSHWDNPRTNQLYYEALKTTDEKKRNALLGDILTYFYNDGPDIVHTFKDTVDAYASNFQGIVPSDSNGWSLGGYRYRVISSK
jgi:peptide/nickel transport system substrate-binding protein